MMSPEWRQTTITFPDPHAADQVAITHLAPILTEAETRQLISAWFYVRKESWRLRYLPASTAAEAEADHYLAGELARLRHDRHISAAVPGIYEPEIHAFGGTTAMDAAHRLWHHDSRHLLSPAIGRNPARHRELSIMLVAAMMRAAGLDWYEQGDVWARVADHREPPEPTLVETLMQSVKRLLTVDLVSLTRREAPLAAARTWFEAYTTAGDTLNHLNQAARLRRGLRAILAHHVIFAWNRRSIPGLYQAAIATAAKTTIFGPDPTSPVSTSDGDS